MGDNNTSSRSQLNKISRHNEWLQLYAGGATQQQIADRYSVSRQAVGVAIKDALKGAASRRTELADHAYELQLERLERLLTAHWPHALNTRDNPDQAIRSSRVVLDILDREAKLFGLDQPVQVEVNVRTRDEIDDELNRLANLLKTNAPSGAPTDVLDAIIVETAQLPEGEQ